MPVSWLKQAQSQTTLKNLLSLSTRHPAPQILKERTEQHSTPVLAKSRLPAIFIHTRSCVCRQYNLLTV